MALLYVAKMNGDSFCSYLTEVGKELSSSAASAKAAVRIHLFTLLFEDCSRLCVELVESTATMPDMVSLVDVTQAALNKIKLEGPETKDMLATPKWITPMLLFIDLYEKVSFIITFIIAVTLCQDLFFRFYLSII